MEQLLKPQIQQKGWIECFNLLWKWQRLTIKGFWRLRDAQLVSIKSLMPTHLKILLLLHPNSRWVHDNTRELRHRNNQTVSTSDQTPSQTYRTALPLWKLLKENFHFSPLCFIPLNESLRRYTKWWNHLNKKAQVLEVFIPWQDSWELNKKILTKFSVFTQDTYIPWICLVCSLFANSHKDTRQFNLQRNQHKPVITSSASMMPSSRQVFPYGNAI